MPRRCNCSPSGVALTSLRPASDLAQGNYFGVPSGIAWENYVYIFTTTPMYKYMVNSLWVTVPTVIGAVSTAARVEHIGAVVAELRAAADDVSPGEPQVRLKGAVLAAVKAARADGFAGIEDTIVLPRPGQAKILVHGSSASRSFTAVMLVIEKIAMITAYGA